MFVYSKQIYILIYRASKFCTIGSPKASRYWSFYRQCGLRCTTGATFQVQLSMMKKLEADLDCHYIKNVSNAQAHLKVIKNANGDNIDWKYIEETLETYKVKNSYIVVTSNTLCKYFLDDQKEV